MCCYYMHIPTLLTISIGFNYRMSISLIQLNNYEINTHNANLHENAGTVYLFTIFF
jgi:hypothetical protein